MSTTVSSLFRTKSVDCSQDGGERVELKRSLTKTDLISLGVGAIIGAGIFVLTGVAARLKAGPGIILSYLVAGVTCAFSALSYAEFASRIPLAGSAYTYAYATFGEFPAFIIGWDLTLEYMIGAAAVARGWSGYFVEMFEGFGVHLPRGFHAIDVGNGVIIDPLAAIVVLVLSAVLASGIKGSSRVNHVFVIATIIIIIFVVFAGCAWADNSNLHPFLPFGAVGVFEGSAMVFFAFIGFDSVCTTAEEVIDPHHDLPVGIVVSLAIATTLYVSVAAVLVSMVKYTEIDLDAPLAAVFGDHGWKWAQSLVSIGAFAALTTSVLSGLISQPRIYFSMSRDGLLPSFLAKVKNGGPYTATLATGAAASFLSLLIDIEVLVEMVSIGTLFAFTLVNGGVLYLRYSGPSGWPKWKPLTLMGLSVMFWLIVSIGWVEQVYNGVPAIFAVLTFIPIVMLARMEAVNTPKSFSCPLVPFVPMMGILGNVFMMAHLTSAAWLRMFVWLIIGLIIYFSYSIRNSVLARTAVSEKEKYVSNPKTDGGVPTELALGPVIDSDEQDSIQTRARGVTTRELITSAGAKSDDDEDFQAPAAEVIEIEGLPSDKSGSVLTSLERMNSGDIYVQ